MWIGFLSRDGLLVLEAKIPTQTVDILDRRSTDQTPEMCCLNRR